MFDSIVDDFKQVWNRPNNDHIQIIVINTFWFVILGLILVFSDYARVNNEIPQIALWFAFPSSPTEFILKPWTILTYMFTHIQFGHFFWNMIILYWFGRITTGVMGAAKNTILFVLGGLSGALLFMLVYQTLPIFNAAADSSTVVGASAGIMAIVVGIATFVPEYSINLLLIGSIRLKYLALGTVVISFLQHTGGNAGGEIAHLGGALIGFIYAKQLKAGNDWGAWIISTLEFFKSFFVKRPSIKVTYKAPPKSAASGKATSSKKSGGFFSKKKPTTSSASTSQEEIDRILDKISQSGYENLSKEEKQKLFEASNK